jgi:dihydropteroate synthase
MNAMFDTTPSFALGTYRLELNRVSVMGILNITSDSFSDGARITDANSALDIAARMVEDGVDILDVGGESTRPGAVAISVQEELDRVIPVITALKARLDRPISIDTSKPEVMRAAVEAGAVLINDVYALRREGALQAAMDTGAAVVLMHMQGAPETMQQAPDYQDVVEDVARFLTERIFSCQMAGLDKKRIIVDPGFGFGKSTAHNMELLGQLGRFGQFECPVLVGLSRKASIGELCQQIAPNGRLAGSLAAHLIAAQRGARIIRTHDVRATVDALRILTAVPAAKSARGEPPGVSSDLAALFG